MEASYVNVTLRLHHTVTRKPSNDGGSRPVTLVTLKNGKQYYYTTVTPITIIIIIYFILIYLM